MSEQDTEKQDSDNTVDEEITNDTEETTEDSNEDAGALKEKNRQLYARLKKAEGELKAKKETPAEPRSPDQHLERLELRVDGYADGEIVEIMKLGGKKALENPIVKKAIDELKTQRIAEGAQVDSDSATSDITRKYSTADLEKMSTADLEKILPRS